MRRTELDANVAAALAYAAGILTGLIFLNLDPYRRNRTVRFHAWQSIFFCLAWMAISMLNGIFSFGSFYLGILTPFVGLAFLVLWVLLIVKAYNGDSLRLPLLSDWADQQADKV